MIQHPRIGIRPTIDGRRQGVRESLEVQTMNMAKSVADLISSTLKYPDGEPVECVISPSTIGRVPEAAASHELFKKSNVCATITVTPCWCYGSETMDMSPDIPHAIWGFNGTERPGAVYLAAVLASHAQKGIPAFGIYGRDVQEANDTDIPEDVKEKLLRYARAALATGLMRDTAYLSMGSVSMGIGGSIVNPDFFQEYLGMRNESVDMTEFTRRMDRGIYDPEEFERAMVWVKEHIKNQAEEEDKPLSDKYIFEKILGKTYAAFKKDQINERVEKLGKLKPITINYNGKSEVIDSKEKLQELMNKAVKDEVAQIS
ncbi:TPA: ZmpA/ZmpB/ZmpC family metallo-endopeptidase [Streptococcus pneumoniae]